MTVNFGRTPLEVMKSFPSVRQINNSIVLSSRDFSSFQCFCHSPPLALLMRCVTCIRAAREQPRPISLDDVPQRAGGNQQRPEAVKVHQHDPFDGGRTRTRESENGQHRPGRSKVERRRARTQQPTSRCSENRYQTIHPRGGPVAQQT